jgi:hypothetical protein
MMMTVIFAATAIAINVSAILATRSSFRAGYWAGVQRMREEYEIWDDDASIIDRVGPPPRPPV